MAVAIPDFGSLASQQKTLNDQATNQTNQANRPNQYNALGSNTWGLGPDGTWTQSSNLNGAAQGLFNTTLGGQQNLAGQVGAGLDYSSLGAMPQVGQYNQQVIDAWQRLQQPDLDRNATAARNRLAAQGITLGSNISNTSEGNINSAYGKARDNAILQGYNQGNTEFTQAMQGRQQGATELQNRFSAAQSGMTALGGVRDSLNPNKWNADVKSSAVFQPLNAYGAAGDTLAGNISNENLDLAKRNQNISGASSLLGAAGGLAGVGSLLGGAYNGASSALGGYYGTGANTYGATFWNGGQDDLSTFLANNNYYGTAAGGI